MGASREEVVPDAAGGLDARENMGEPGQHPGDDEDYQFDFLEALKDLLELLVLLEEEGKHHVANDTAEGANVFGEEVPEVGLACLLHEVVALVVAEEHDEDRGHVVEPLNVLQLLILCKETVENLQYVLLSFLANYHDEYRWNLVISSKVFIEESER